MSTTRTPTQRRKGGNRYPARCRTFARALYERGASIAEVIEKLAEHGVTPSRRTVVYWCDPDAYRAYNVKRASLHPSAKERKRESEWWAKRKRMRELRAAGLSCADVAKVMNLDYGMDLHRDQVRAILDEAKAPVKNPRMVIERASA